MLQTKPCAAGGQKSEKNCSRMGVFFFFIYFYREREGDGSFCRSISGEASPTDPTPPSLLCRPASCPLTDHGRCDGLIRLVSSLLISCYTTPPACQLLQRELLLLSLSLSPQFGQWGGDPRPEFLVRVVVVVAAFKISSAPAFPRAALCRQSDRKGG